MRSLALLSCKIGLQSSEHYPPEGKLRVYRSRSGGDAWEPLGNGLPQRDCYVNVLRDAMAVDVLEPCGVYFGTTGGQVYVSADAGDHWMPIVRDLLRMLTWPRGWASSPRRNARSCATRRSTSARRCRRPSACATTGRSSSGCSSHRAD